MLALSVNDAQIVLEHSGCQLSINETSSAAVVNSSQGTGRRATIKKLITTMSLSSSSSPFEEYVCSGMCVPWTRAAKFNYQLFL